MSDTVAFVHLRVHSAYSLAEGAIRVKDLVKTCAGQHMPACAITDTNNLFGALEFAQSASGAGVQPVTGVQISLRREERDGPQAHGPKPAPDKMVLLVQNEAGYLNLMKLVSRAFLNTEAGETPQIGMADLAECHDGLIALTGGIDGPVGRLLVDGQNAAAEACLKHLKDIFSNRLYVEIQRHFLVDEEKIEPILIDFAYELDIPLVATNDCYFPEEKMYEAHDALLCIAQGTVLTDPNRRKLTPHHRFKTAGEMRELFADLPEAVDNTVVIAQRCAYMPEKIKPLLPDYTKRGDRTSEEALKDLAEAGLRERLENEVYTDDMDAATREEVAKPYWDRLAYELGIIGQMGFPGYFLIVADFIQWTKGHDIPVGPGRGSGAGSVVAWALTITDLDPLKYALLFERFLNPERVSMPDFDIDFCQDRRDEVIRYVQKEYGFDKVAQIITFGKLQARAVLRDVGRVLQMPYGQVDRICKLVPNNPANPVTLAQAIEGEPLLQQQIYEDEAVSRLVTMAKALEGLYRHASTHAAGVVIGDRPLDQLVALYRDPRSDMPVTQFNMKFVEQAGLVKFDFLGLKTLTVIDKARRLIDLRDDRDAPLDIAKIPLDDPKSYDMLCRGISTGVFQLESSGMRDVLKNLKPDRLEDLIAVVALYRPGPMENIPTYIKRKHGEEEPIYPHPKLEPVLKETFGIPIYQEQVMQMAQVLAGYTLGGADLLRRAMGKKIQAEMDEQRAIFVAGAKEHSDVDAKQANQIFDMINAFAGYGFNKSHAAAYALVAYQTAWLKANYPVEFMAASMTLDMHNTDKLNVFREEIARLKIGLLPPDVNKSDVAFSVEKDENGDRCVRYALAALKNVGSGAMESVIAARNEGGPFKDVFDFAERVDSKALNKRLVENLTKAGAFDSLEPNRRRLFESLENVLGHGSATQADRTSAQAGLFGGDLSTQNRPKLQNVPEWGPTEKLSNEFDAIGFYMSAHPLEAYEASCAKLGVSKWSDVQSGRVALSKGVKLAGIVGGRRLMTTSRGSKMAFVAMSDATGNFEVTLFSEVLAGARELLDSGQPLLMVVNVDKKGEGPDAELRLTANSVKSLDEEAAQAAKGMRIIVNGDSDIPKLRAIFEGHAKPGRGRIELRALDTDQGDVDFALDKGYQVTAAFRQAVKAIPGIVDVQDL
ncbi:DNA polymerase III subunit alpha [Rhodospirillaceae bacterium KN72]|uniref:DNA polymerase III subunit alpha n=1 Tax=Pacificispira spongiicola TaxID=2729598 RepID=A0A7Y0DYR2_9PROT|nr:DNA polymerase III subunit alpha [Pacificispira spongiicola]NMM44066.1 DNA polymerase III subunit alpha [Pacificispira spongiicola]